ncbi:MAG: hypothetical protein Q8900_00270 [Bacillota bacterium]|nr:hypothetical protein [Bacillota bacterium]
MYDSNDRLKNEGNITYGYDNNESLKLKTDTSRIKVNNYLYDREQYDLNTKFYYLRDQYMNPSNIDAF